MVIRWIVLIFVQFLSVITAQSTIQVDTKLGKIQGLVVNKDGKIVNQFLKVPYAKPPIGDLRFKKPLPIQSWTGVYDATSYGPSCMQVRLSLVDKFITNSNLSEDCLHLNIYVPNQIDLSVRKSVMIWIHGGGFRTGEGEMYEGSNLSIIGDLIVVTINYRLGVFGFLNTGDKVSPGNYGLWDQLMAIKWVKENIANFGGDPNSITIFGESAGAFSVSMLLISPLSEGLFQRVIAQSGSCLTPSFLKHAGHEAVSSIAKKLNCPVSSLAQDETISCLHNVSAADLLVSSSGYAFGPVLDGELIPNYPERLLNNKLSKSYSLFMSRDFMSGVNSGEGGLFFPQVPRLLKGLNISDGISSDIFCHKIVPTYIDRYFSGNIDITHAACEQYKANNDIDMARNTIDFVGDLDFVAPMIKLLNLHNASSSATYQYLFSQQTSLLRLPLPSWYNDANHGDELGFVFGMLNLNPNTLPGDQSLADMMMTYWSNFAKYGNPNGNKQHNNLYPNWQSYTINRSYINLSHNTSEHDHLFQRRMNFWLKTVPALGVKNNDPLTSLFG